MTPEFEASHQALTPENQEVELKFLATPSGFKACQQWQMLDAAPAALRAQRLSSSYFDTENRDLERHGMVLRVRKQGREHIMAMKWVDPDAGPFGRGEVEVVCPGPDPDPDLLAAEYCKMLRDVIQDRRLVKVFSTEIRRLVRHVSSDVAEIEVAFDTGCIHADDRKQPVREIELELKSGDPAELYRLGTLLAESYPVRLGVQAKAVRAQYLQKGEPPPVARSFPAIAGAPSVDEAIGQVINACLSHFLANFPAFEAGDAVGAVHQMRVAMRRLRSILGVFSRAFPGAGFDSVRAKAKRVAAVLGEARDWDVFLQLLQDGPLAAFPGEPGFEPIIAAVEQRRAVGHAAVKALLEAPETTAFLLSLQSFVARRAWRNGLAAEALPRLTAPAKTFAAAHLGRMQAKLIKRGKHLRAMNPHQRHRLRIGLKKLRYTADLFGGLFEADELQDLVKTATKLQDRLGARNDLVGGLDMLARLDLPMEGLSFAGGIIAGWCRHAASPEDETLLKVWKKFRKVSPLGV